MGTPQVAGTVDELAQRNFQMYPAGEERVLIRQRDGLLGEQNKATGKQEIDKEMLPLQGQTNICTGESASGTAFLPHSVWLPK